MKKILAGVTISLMATFSGAVEMGTGIWQQTTSGTIASTLDLAGDLGLESSNDMYLYVNVNMPLIIPNIKFRTQALTATGSGTMPIAAVAGFAGIDLSGVAGNTAVDTTFDLSYTDVVTHYGIPLLPLIDVDFGLNFRMINGNFAITDGVALDESEGVTLLIPMGHVAIGGKIPATGLSLYGEYNTLPLGDTSVTDLMVKARYKLPLPTLVLDLGVEAGYHAFTMTVGDKTVGVDTSELASEISSKGLFVGVSANF